MKPQVVADVGNTRVKWGLCRDGRVVDTASLPPDDVAAWEKQCEAWDLPDDGVWVVAGVHPQRRDRLAGWLADQRQHVTVLDDPRQLPLEVRLEHPQRVGIDRLLNAVALRKRPPYPAPAVLVDAGSAVTVDWVDATGAFCGGAIFPGMRLMAKVLHDYTALLPEIPVPSAAPPVPGASTPDAMRVGIFWATVGGIQILARHLGKLAREPARVFLTGGDGPALAGALGTEAEVWPEMTLEGLLLAAEGLS